MSVALISGVSDDLDAVQSVVAGLTLRKLVLSCTEEHWTSADKPALSLCGTLGDVGLLAPGLDVDFALLCAALEADRLDTLDEARDTLYLSCLCAKVWATGLKVTAVDLDTTALKSLFEVAGFGAPPDAGWLAEVVKW